MDVNLNIDNYHSLQGILMVSKMEKFLELKLIF